MSLIKWIVKFFMAELNYILKKHYSNHFNTLKNTSYDKNNDTYLCNSTLDVLDFDGLTKSLNPHKQPSSFDCLLCNEEEKKVYCVEFKNQEKSMINNKELHNKLKDGKSSLDGILHQHNISKDNYDFIFCVAFKASKMHYKYRRKIELTSIYFNLEKYSDKFDDIITNDIEFFTTEFHKKYSCK